MPLTPEQVQQYEVAASALEIGRIPKDGLGVQACDVIVKQRGIKTLTLGEMHQLCKAAARLLRECIRENKTLDELRASENGELT